MADTEPSFWSVVWAHIVTMAKWAAAKLLAPGVAVLVVILAVVLVSMGWKELQIGGLLGKLLGKKDPEGSAIDVANSVPADRIGPDGKLIPQGTPDSQGLTQAVIVPIKDPGLFSNPDTVTFTAPGADKPTVVKLPDGVKSKDVEHVIVVQPNMVVVSVKDDSNIPSQHIDDLLTKYGG